MSQSTAPTTRGLNKSTSKSQAEQKQQRQSKEQKAAKKAQAKTSEEDVITCDICQRRFVDIDDKLLQCGRCDLWQCIACLKYSDTGYDLLNQRPELHWSCTACQAPAIHAIRSDKEIGERCNYYMAKFTSRVAALEEQMTTKADNTEVEATKQNNNTDGEERATSSRCDHKYGRKTYRVQDKRRQTSSCTK